MRVLRIDKRSPYRQLVGVGGLGSGSFFRLEGNDTLGRNESRRGALLNVRDYCKLHIVSHYVAKLLGAEHGRFSVVPVGRMGNDAAGAFVFREMRAIGIDTRFVKMVTGKPTLFSVCFQYPDGSGGNITTSNSAAADLSAKDIDGIEDLISPIGKQTIALLVPEVPLEVREHFLQVARRRNAFCAASFISAEIGPAKRSRMFEQLDLVSLNEEEAANFVGESFSSSTPQSFIEKCVYHLARAYPTLRLIVSFGKGGAYAISREGWSHCAAPRVQVASTAGAGDCLLGGVLAALAAGIPFSRKRRSSESEFALASALDLGVLLASYKVTSPHTIHPTASLDELADFAREIGASVAPEIEGLITEIRQEETAQANV
jgi:sugar/nucleoside kinase (ribokinase family)